MYRTREFAELAGVTARTFHHYDRLGLLNLADALRTQRRLLEEKRLMPDRAIHAIGEAEAWMRSGGAAGKTVIRRIIEVI